MDKQQRQQAIRGLIGREPVGSQAELVERLRAEGIPCTQASVSRDLRELGVVKANGRYVPLSHVPATAEMLPDTRGFIERVDAVGANLVIVRTSVGAAQQVGVSIDELHSDDIAGTIAGDDTIFIAVPSRAAQGRVLALLRGRPSRAG